MELEELTKRQVLCLRAITSHFDEDDLPPTHRQIADRMGLATRRSVVDHVKALERKGWIVKTDENCHNIRPLYYPDGRPFPSRSELQAKIRRLERLAS